MKSEYWCLPNLILKDKRIVLSRWTSLPKRNPILTPFYFKLNYDVLINTASNMQTFNRKFNIYDAFSSSTLSRLTPFSMKLSNDTAHVFEKYFTLRQSSFINFFNERGIDVPICFQNSGSLRRSNFEFPLLKFTNFLMREGKREKICISLLKAFQLIFLTSTKTSIFSLNWFFLYNLVNLIFTRTNKFVTLNCRININTLNNHFLYDKQKNFLQNCYFYNFLWNAMDIITPLFTFSVYNVDKNLRKFSRSKKNRYVFVWKYVPLYKRNLRALRLVSKDIKFIEGRTFVERMHESFRVLKTSPKESFVWKINKFSHNYVFKNFKKTLLKTLKSTS